MEDVRVRTSRKVADLYLENDSTLKQLIADAQKILQERQDADIVPAVGKIWRYKDRFYTSVVDSVGGNLLCERLVFSIPIGGGLIHGWWYADRFSNSEDPTSGKGWLICGQDIDAYPEAVIRLIKEIQEAVIRLIKEIQ